MKGSEFHKEMETGEVQGRNISRKGGHALALAHELVSLSWQKLDAIYSFFFVPPLGNQVLARENRRLCSKFHILCFQTYTIFKAQALLNIELGPKMIQFKIQFKIKSGILIPKRYSFK